MIPNRIHYFLLLDILSFNICSFLPSIWTSTHYSLHSCSPFMTSYFFIPSTSNLTFSTTLNSLKTSVSSFLHDPSDLSSSNLCLRNLLYTKYRTTGNSLDPHPPTLPLFPPLLLVYYCLHCSWLPSLLLSLGLHFQKAVVPPIWSSRPLLPLFVSTSSVDYSTRSFLDPNPNPLY